jgi:TatA/E family protein of Tat protein translocase
MIGSLGLPELIFIFVLALLVFGPKRLPEMGRMVGKGMAEFRKATNELKRTINAEIALEDEDGPPASRRNLTPVQAGTVARSGSGSAAAFDGAISPMAALGGDVVVVPAPAEESGGDVVDQPPATASAAPRAPVTASAE